MMSTSRLGGDKDSVIHPFTIAWDAPPVTFTVRSVSRMSSKRSWQLVGAANQLARRALERLRRALEQLFRHFQHVADLVDQQADRAVVGLHDHVHGQLVGGPVAQLETAAQVDGRDDLPAQVDQPAHHRRGQRHARHLLVADDFLHLQHVQAEVSGRPG